MTRRPLPPFVLALVASIAAAAGLSAAEAGGEPRLLLNIVVEGLDAETLELLNEKFAKDGGFRKLREGALTLTNADYGTYLDPTAATAMLMTGASPSVNGVAEAKGFDRETLRTRPLFLDGTVLGNFTSDTFSPAALRVSTVADEARIAAGGVNVAYAVAPSASQAIVLGGHTANSALWLDPSSANWASSTFYRDMPGSVATRNRMRPLTSRMDTMSWSTLLPSAEYPALPEHLRKYSFRYVIPRGAQNMERVERFASSPLGNAEVTDLAIELIRNLSLGKHDGTDVLSLAYTLAPFPYTKSPDSRLERQDAYVRLDRDLGRLFRAADSPAGGRVAIMLAGTPASPLSRRDEERWAIPYGEFSTRKAASLLNMYLIALHGNGDYVSGFHNGCFYLNHKTIQSKGLKVGDVRAEVADFLVKMTGVDEAYTLEDIIAGRAGQQSEALRRNTPLETAGDVFLYVAPGVEIIDDYSGMAVAAAGIPMVNRAAATTAPVFIFAPGVDARTVDTPVDARVIAPTVSRILRIRSPNGASLPPLSLRQ
ncbi:MAG: alkaline phosphatase family protein [Muribaculaceae bacterium]|nr:alkaline phosphatase family protein [Muribaculaceae bacterium]